MSDRKILTVYQSSYHSNAAPLTSTTKQRDVVNGTQQWLNRAGLTHDPVEVIVERINKVHAPAYVEAVLSGDPRDIAESQGFRWSPEFATSVVDIWEGHETACMLAVFHEQMVLHPVSGAHHAGKKRGQGFCTFNFLVGGPRPLLDSGRIDSVAIIDLDAHFGNGTSELVRKDRRYSLFDISGFGGQVPPNRSDWRFFSAKDWSQYAGGLTRLPVWLDIVQPDLVEYNAGVDCHMNDRVGGIPGVTAAFLEWRDEFVFRSCRERHIPMVVNLAGGYQDRGFSSLLHIATVKQMYALANSKEKS